MDNIFERAKWIWNDKAESENAYVNFVFMSTLSEGESVFRISAETDYALYADEELISFGQFADYPFDKVYDEIDLSAFGGKDVCFTLTVWYQGKDTSTHRNELPGVIFELVSNGEIIVSSSRDINSGVNTAFKNGRIEDVSGQLGVTFSYDAGVIFGEKKGSVSLSTETQKSKPTRLRPVKKLSLCENEPAVLKVSGSFTEKKADLIGQRMQNASMTFGKTDVSRVLPSSDGIVLDAAEGEDGVFAIIDTGRENTGLLSLDIDLPEDAEILIGWGEHLEDLRVRAYVGGRNFCASYKGKKGRNVFLNPFRRLGMRYLQLNIYSKSAKIYYAGIRTTDYPFDNAGDFACADNLHNKIYEVCKRSLVLSVHEHYEDCPWREQALYAMDSRNQMLCGYYAFGEYDMPKASIRLIAESLREDGILELCSPARVCITIPAFSAMFLTQVYEYCEYSKDLSLAIEIKDVILRVAEEFLSRIDSDGFMSSFVGDEYWNFYEWQEGLEGYGKPTDLPYSGPLMAFVSLGLKNVGLTLELLGEDGSKYKNAHRKLNSALAKYFWNEERGAFASWSDGNGALEHYAELTNALCVCCGATEGEKKALVLAALAGEKLIPVTLSHSIFKYEALMSDKEKYARYVFSHIAKLWGSMLYRGATTFWETIDGAPAFDNAGSLCHGWSAVPLYFYHRYALDLEGSVTGLYECRIINKGE